MRSAEQLKTLWLIVRPASYAVAAYAAVVFLAVKWAITRNAILIFLLSVGLAYVIAPLTKYFRRAPADQRSVLSPVSSMLLIYLGLMVTGMTVWMVAGEHLQQEAADFRARLPVYTEQARQRLALAEQVAGEVPAAEPFAGFSRSLAAGIFALIRSHAVRVQEEIAASRPVLSWLWLVPAISLLLIGRVRWFERSAVTHLPKGHLRWRGEEFIHQVNSILAGYTRAQLLSCLIIAALSLVGFWIVGVPYAPLMAIASGVLEVLPAVGPITVAIATLAVVDADRLLALIGFLLAMRLAQDYVIYPRLVGHRMHLHPVAVVCVILAGAAIGGMLGVLAAIPLVGVSAVALRHWREYWEIESIIQEHGQMVEEAVQEPDAGAETP